MPLAVHQLQTIVAPQYRAHLAPALLPFVEFVLTPAAGLSGPLGGRYPFTGANYTQTVGARGRQLSFNSGEIDTAIGQSIAYSNGASLLVVGRRRSAAGIQPLIARGGGSSSGGFEIALCNSFGSPTSRIYGSFHNGTAQGNFDAGYVNGIPDSLNGSFDTETDKWYAIAAGMNTLPSFASAAITVGLIPAGSHTLTGDVALVVFFKERLANETLRKLSEDPLSAFARGQRHVWIADAGGGGGGGGVSHAQRALLGIF